LALDVAELPENGKRGYVMSVTMLASAATSTTSPSSAFNEYVLHHLRVAHIKARLIVNRVGFAQTALRQGWISGETALGIVAEAGMLPFVVGSSS
jgi:hypothetical protein